MRMGRPTLAGSPSPKYQAVPLPENVEILLVVMSIGRTAFKTTLFALSTKKECQWSRANADMSYDSFDTSALKAAFVGR